MSASKDAKAAGLPNLKYVYTQANVKRTTFNGWYHNNRQLFDVVVAGVKSIKDKHEKNTLNYRPNGFYEDSIWNGSGGGGIAGMDYKTGIMNESLKDERLACLNFVKVEGDKLKYERVKFPSLKDSGEIK